MNKITRRTVLSGAGAVAGASIIGRRARAAEFNLKYGNDLPAAHPINKRASEACDAIRAATNGRVDIQIFPNSQLGGSTDMLSQVRSGALDIFTVGSPLANVIPVSSISSIAFAFPNFDGVWAAVDGDLGGSYPPADRHDRLGGIRQDVGQRLPPDHDQQQADQRAERSQRAQAARAGEPALHLDVPRARHRADRDQLRRGLHGAADEDRRRPGESARPDRGREVLRGAEVLLAHRPHVGRLLDGGEPQNWEQLPQDLRDTTARLLNEGAVKQREDMAKLNTTLEAQLKEKGLIFNTVNKKPFQETLKTAGFYSEWRQKYGEEAWKILERYSGNLT